MNSPEYTRTRLVSRPQLESLARELSELVYARERLIRRVCRAKSGVRRLMERAGIQLARLAKKPFGPSMRRVLFAIATGESDVEHSAALSAGGLSAPLGPLAQALRARLFDHQRVLLAMQLDEIGACQARLRKLEARIAARVGRLHVFRVQPARLPEPANDNAGEGVGLCAGERSRLYASRARAVLLAAQIRALI